MCAHDQQVRTRWPVTRRAGQSHPFLFPFCSQPPHTQPPGGSKSQKRTLDGRQDGRWGGWLRRLGVAPLLVDRDLDRDHLLQTHACSWRGPLAVPHRVLSQNRGSVCSQALAFCQQATPKGQHGKRGPGGTGPKGHKSIVQSSEGLPWPRVPPMHGGGAA